MMTLEKLNTNYSNAPFTALAREGKWSEAADQAAKMGMWGIWAECRTEAGLACDETARAEVLAKLDAARKADFMARKAKFNR